MEQIKFSVITTVLNEATEMGSLLDSLFKQTLKPAEVVIVDAGSTDGTTEKINEWRKQHVDFPVRLIGQPMVNRSKGRNLAIEKAQEEYIAVIDAGCKADKNWLEELSKRFAETGAESVAGFYNGKPKNVWEEIFNLYLAVQPKKFDPKTYLPSSRSLAMTKTAWQKVGKYPEKLNTCEDLVFAQKLKTKTKLAATQKAIVYWTLPDGLGSYFRTVAGYAQGDVEAQYKPHTYKIASVFGRYFFFLFIPWLFLLYLVYPQFKFIHAIRIPKLFLTPVVQIVTDMAVMWGAIKGIFGRMKLIN